MIVSEPADQQCSSKFPELQFSSACQRIISYVSPYTLYIHWSHRPRWPPAPWNSVAQNVYLTCYINPNYPH